MMIDLKLWELAQQIVGEVPPHYEFVYFIVLVFLCMALVFILVSPFMFLFKITGGE